MFKVVAVAHVSCSVYYACTFNAFAVVQQWKNCVLFTVMLFKSYLTVTLRYHLSTFCCYSSYYVCGFTFVPRYSLANHISKVNAPQLSLELAPTPCLR